MESAHRMSSMICMLSLVVYATERYIRELVGWQHDALDVFDDAHVSPDIFNGEKRTRKPNCQCSPESSSVDPNGFDFCISLLIQISLF